MFDTFENDDYVLAFFPCTRFENQILMAFRGEQNQQQKWSDEKKLEYDLQLHDELHLLYTLITKMTIVCIRKGLKLVIENPYSTQHYLTRYWAMNPKVIIKDRKMYGDYYTKPTQFWFINFEPSNNFLFEPIPYHEHKNIEDTHNKVERSLISPYFANRFIREFIL